MGVSIISLSVQLTNIFWSHFTYPIQSHHYTSQLSTHYWCYSWLYTLNVWSHFLPIKILFPIIYSWPSADEKHTWLLHCTHYHNIPHLIKTWLCNLFLTFLSLNFTQSQFCSRSCFYTKLCHISSDLKSLYWLKTEQHIQYKLSSITYKTLPLCQPSYLHKNFNVQSNHATLLTLSFSNVVYFTLV